MPGVRQVKAQLSAYLAEVQEGQEVTITDHGRLVARIVPAGSTVVAVASLIDHLSEEGMIDPPSQPKPPSGAWQPVTISPGHSPSQTVIDDRR
jgi:prevent-host-death family protein